ncbi:unnamed protein product, partial [Allacma fusca]
RSPSALYPRVKYEWPYSSDFRKPSLLWKLKSTITCFAVGLWGKSVLCLLNTTKFNNLHVLTDAIFRRPPGVPLVTLANHESCVDDPCLIGAVMTNGQLLKHSKMRWSLVASDICYRKPWHGWIMGLGKCPPVVRGDGVYQKAVDFVIDRLNEGGWLHVFPEGKVNMEREELSRLKWGIGRIVADLERPPIIIPFWHVGIQNIMPNYRPYYPRIGKKLFVNIGKPIDVSVVLKNVEDKKASEKRKIITDYIQAEMEVLRRETIALAKIEGITSESDSEAPTSDKHNGLI